MEDIPKWFVPIKKGDIPGRVRRRITEGLSKGAVLAWQSRPKARAPGGERTGSSDHERPRQQRQQPPQPPPIWGEINHPGWSPPDSHDLPNVEYAVVIAELPYLIEEKALAVAARQLDPPPEFASRRPCMSLARYISYLKTLGYVDYTIGGVFVREYEKCRFWLGEVEGVSEPQFRLLMKVFARLLNMMDGRPVEGDIDDSDELDLDCGLDIIRTTMRGGIQDADVYGSSAVGSSQIGDSTGVSAATGSMFASTDPGTHKQHDVYRPDPARCTDDYTDGELEQQQSIGREAVLDGRGRNVYSGLQRIITRTTTGSGSSRDGSVRRVGGWSDVTSPRTPLEAMEMRYLRPRIGSRVRQRTSQGTFG